MAKSIQVIRGMHDILPSQIHLWHVIEDNFRQIVTTRGYQQIRTPVVEKSDLFHRSIGEVTDIVEKEMYTFEDRNGDWLSLRPEGTASVVRAGIENGLLVNQQQRLWYNGPMFRHERPQKGRYRQFYQLGAETFGMPGADVEVELILIAANLWKALGLKNIELQVNSLGTSESRHAYRGILVDYFNQNIDQLDEESKRRLKTNPLRILDTKNPNMQELVEQAPKLSEHLDEASQTHFNNFKVRLDALGINYVVNTRLVRGLDYYCHTVFEWVTTELGAQGTVCAGGRYDGLVEQMGGKPTTAAGFAMGIERLVSLLEETETVIAQVADIYCLALNDEASIKAFELSEKIRSKYPNLNIIQHCGGGSFKSQIKKADKSGATWALIMAEDELQNDSISIKFLRENKDQKTVKQNDLMHEIKSWFEN
ncbi:MAG: histidine--tRNA ligase [Gammaproteobacteria bacterium]|nr:histidine--tRNA ligase [Gammaproteobacteria bacterium]